MVKRKSLNETIKKDEEEGLREIFSLENPEDTKEVKITQDGEQFSIKIPRDFAREMQIDTKKDHFVFTLLFEETDESKKILEGRLIKYEEEK